jgi:curved DNA-binding protein
MPRDYYEVLGIDRKASAEEIEKAHRKLAMKFHPDRNPGDKEAEARFKEVQEAFDVLGNQQKRQQYDQFGHGFQSGSGAGPGGGGTYRGFNFNWGAPGGASFEFGSEGGDPQEIFEQIFGGGQPRASRTGRRRTARPKPQDQDAEVDVDFLTAARGGKVELTLSTGQGQKELSVAIPAGIADGGTIRIKGQAYGGGDLYIKVNVKPHPHLLREGQDLILPVPITLAEAVQGGKIDVPTLDGIVTVSVPAGSSTGRRLRLRGKGLATPGEKSERGDFYVEIRIVVPAETDERSKELIEQFARRNPHDPRSGIRWAL